MALRALLLLLCLSACYRHQWPLTPGVVSYSTYKIYMDDRQGTAWVVDKHHLVTAGHVCRGGGDAVIQGDIRSFRASPVLWSYGNGVHDLCVLETRVALERPLVVADVMPRVGDPVFFVGYPSGEYVESSGTFLGDLDGDWTYNNAVSSAPCGPGASGSALYTSQGVWGVLVRQRTDGGYIHDPSEGCAVVDLQELRRFLREAGINYLTPPLDPTNDLP